jgi:peptide/nickel transport system permease protein
VFRLICQRLGLGLITLLAASVLIFAGTEVLPGDLASAILQNSATPENLAELRKELGLERPAVVRYVEWLAGAVQGDFGHSLANKRDVVEELTPRVKDTSSWRATPPWLPSPWRCSWGSWRRCGRGASTTG